MGKTILTIFNLMICVITSAQIIDNYGIKIGTGLSNQYWKFKVFSDLSDWNDYKIGFTGQLFVEKYIGKNFTIRPVIGYIQKGYVGDIIVRTEYGDELKHNKLILHNISLDLSTNIIPIQTSFKPYLTIGFRVDYLIDYKYVIYDCQGEDLVIDLDTFDNFNKLLFIGLLGIGVAYKDFIFLEFEYNPSITKNLDDPGLAINDRYFDLTLGISINKIIKKE